MLKQIVPKSHGLNPFLVIATAGTTNTGSIDPLNKVADIAKSNGLWYHVDAAYGGFFMLLDEQKEKFKGIERSDSLVLDPHKGMFLPFGIGVVLVKDKHALLKAHQTHAAYMVDTEGVEEINPGDCGHELTKHFRGMRMWLPLHYHGLDAFRACLREKLILCQYFHREIQKMGFENGPDPSLSVKHFRYPAEDKNDINKRLVEKLHEDGRIFFFFDGIGWGSVDQVCDTEFSYTPGAGEIGVGYDYREFGKNEISLQHSMSLVGTRNDG